MSPHTGSGFLAVLLPFFKLDASGSGVLGLRGVCVGVMPNLVPLLSQTGSHYKAQAGLQFVIVSSIPASCARLIHRRYRSQLCNIRSMTPQQHLCVGGTYVSVLLCCCACEHMEKPELDGRSPSMFSHYLLRQILYTKPGVHQFD